MKPLLFAFPADAAFAAGIARRCEMACGELRLHEFPDGEKLVRLEGDCAGRDVAIVSGGRDATLNALPLYFAAAAARDLGARSVGLVSPYLAYMRQDTRFHPGEAVSAVHYARFLSGAFDWLVTVDPHLHRFESLGAVYSIPAVAVSATGDLAEWIGAEVFRPVIIGPDRESEQWAGQLARRIGAPFTVLDKIRSGDRDVSVSSPDPRLLDGRTPVIVDDIASSGRTLARTIEAVRSAGGANPVCMVVHAVFSGDAEAVITRAGAARIVSTNSIAHPTNAIDISARVAEAVLGRLAAGGVNRG
jgi:ribose-phosphate pyrophosphokinase